MNTLKSPKEMGKSKTTKTEQDNTIYLDDSGTVIVKKNGDDLRTRYYLDGGKYKLKPYVNINKKPGFDELLESLEVIRHCKKNQFTMNEIYHDDFKSFHSDIGKIADFCRQHDVTKTVEIEGLVDCNALLNHYKADVFSEIGVEYTKSKTKIKKYDEQRIRNASVEKTMDNFRYAILRSYGLASANQFPYGVRLDTESNELLQYDNSNLTEFLILNSYSYLKKQYTNMSKNGLKTLEETDVVYDTLTKKQIIDVIDEIKDKFPVSYPAELDSFLSGVEDDGASSVYRIQEVIGKSGVDNLLDKLMSVHVLIGMHDAISNELESLNNKNNPWLAVNFAYQKIKQKTDVNFVTEAKLALKNDDFDDAKDYFSDLIDRAPEHVLVPVIALDIFSKSNFRLNSDDSKVNFETLAYLMQGKQIERALSKYHSITEIPKFNYRVVNDMYSDESLEVWGKYEKKLKRLRKIVKYLKRKSSVTKSLLKKYPELANIAASKIDALISRQFSYNTYATLALIFASNGKSLINSPINVTKAMELYLETHFGDKVFSVSETSYEYTIKDTEFQTLITDTDFDGYSNAHIGRAEYFISEKLDEYLLQYQDYEDYQGTNEERVEMHVAELKDITKLLEFGWYEDTTSGNIVWCGYNESDCENVSWEHIQNDTQTYGAIRANETNSGDGAKTKAFKTTSEYYQYILDQQDVARVKKTWKDEDDRLVTKSKLKKVIQYYKIQETKEGLGI